MSRLYINGFEGGNLGQIFNTSSRLDYLGAIRIVTNDQIPSLSGYEDHEPPRCGNRVVALTGNGIGIRFLPETIQGFGNHLTQIYFSFKIQQIDSGYFTSPWCALGNNIQQNHFYIEDDTDGIGIHVLNVGYNNDFLDHWSLTHYRWNLIEIWYKLSTDRNTADGEFEFRLNGETIVSQPNYATSYAATSAGSYISRASISSGGIHSYILVDDIIIDTTAAFDISSGNIVSFKPTSDNVVNWTPSTGSNSYEIIDNTGLIRDMPDREYISTDSTAEASFDIGMDGTNTLDAGSTIYSVQTESFVSKFGEPNVNYVRSFLDISGTKYFGDSHKVPINNFYPQSDIWETNPNTLSDWTNTDISNLFLGIKGE